MHTNNMGGHGPTNREIDAKVLALRAAIAEDQIRRQQNKVNNNNHTMDNPQYHAGLIPSHSFNQRMDMLHQQHQQQQQHQQAPPYYTGQTVYQPPLNGQHPYHQHMNNTQPSPQSLDDGSIPEDILASLMNIDQLNQILENGNKVINMSNQVMPLIDQQTSAQLFGVATNNMQSFIPPPTISPPKPPKPQPLIKAPNHKRSASAITTYYHPTLMEEMEHPNTNTFMTPPGTPMHQNNNPLEESYHYQGCRPALSRCKRPRRMVWW